MRGIVILTLLLTMVGFANGQGFYIKADLIKEFSEMPLMVSCNDPQMKELFEKNVKSKWPFPNQKITFITTKEAESIKRLKDPKIALLLCEHSSEIETDNGQMKAKGDFYYIKACIVRKWNFETVMTTVFFTRMEDLEMDYSFNYFNRLALMVQGKEPYSIAGDVERLKSKTLLITQEMLDPKIDFATAKAEYGGKIKMVNTS